MTNDYRRIILTGKAYIKYYDEPNEVYKGDMRLFLNSDSTSPIVGDYDNTTFSGYFKAEVYDGKHWQVMDLSEFLEDREYKYAKRQRPIDTAILCRELLAVNCRDVELFRTYRGHFTRDEHIPVKRITKANRNRKNS